MGAEKYSGLIAGQKFTRRVEIAQRNREARVMQPDIWDEWWRPACVLDMQPAMWSTRCRRACVRSHAERHTGCHQPEADWLVSPINTPRPQIISSHPDLSKSTPWEGSVQLKVNQVNIRSDGSQVNASSVQSAILYDCDAEALSNSVRPSQSYSMMVKWRCCPELVQNHGFRSVEVLLDTPPGSPKNCPRAKGGSVQIRPSRPVSVFMVKPRACPSRGQFSPVQSRYPLGFGQVLFDQPAASRLEHCELVPVIFKDSFSAGGWTIWRVQGNPLFAGSGRLRETGSWPMAELLHDGGDRILPIERRNTMSPGPRPDVVLFPLLEARSWQEAKSNLVTVALGRGVKFVTLTGLSLARHVALPDLGVGLGGQSCSCLIVGWPVGLSSPTLGVGRPSVMFLFDCWPVGRPMLRTVLGCYSGGIRAWDENLKVEGVRGQTQTRSERGETDSENWAVVWTGQMGRNKTSLGKDFISIWEMRDRGNGWSNQRRRLARSYHGKLDTQGTVKGRVKRYEDDYGDFRQYTQRDMGKQSKEL
ncbi:hypothetical protein IGI04_036036 [Brassica rapa subsp. trilocularis]|uniref:DUF4283 domain-containing protein n=1 Tax=Brassica rapa subsp. trilocularis TaxID=1813537 RepID=A0ABQ7LFN1_BRACM|nr:hypothetical protein IGI04_036036 [Brassica rapa subsp. trilocularis]